MIRTNVTAVRSVIQTALTDDEIDALIIQSNSIVTDYIGNTTTSVATFKSIETWLTAHLIAIGKERQPISEKVGDIWLQWEKLGGKGFLEMTTYGQMVLFLDKTGSFQQFSMKRAYVRAVKQNTYRMGDD